DVNGGSLAGIPIDFTNWFANTGGFGDRYAYVGAVGTWEHVVARAAQDSSNRIKVQLGWKTGSTFVFGAALDPFQGSGYNSGSSPHATLKVLRNSVGILLAIGIGGPREIGETDAPTWAVALYRIDSGSSAPTLTLLDTRRGGPVLELRPYVDVLEWSDANHLLVRYAELVSGDGSTDQYVHRFLLFDVTGGTLNPVGGPLSFTLADKWSGFEAFDTTTYHWCRELHETREGTDRLYLLSGLRSTKQFCLAAVIRFSADFSNLSHSPALALTTNTGASNQGGWVLLTAPQGAGRALIAAYHKDPSSNDVTSLFDLAYTATPTLSQTAVLKTLGYYGDTGQIYDEVQFNTTAGTGSVRISWYSNLDFAFVPRATYQGQYPVFLVYDNINGIDNQRRIGLLWMEYVDLGGFVGVEPTVTLNSGIGSADDFDQALIAGVGAGNGFAVLHRDSSAPTGTAYLGFVGQAAPPPPPPPEPAIPVSAPQEVLRGFTNRLDGFGRPKRLEGRDKLESTMGFIVLELLLQRGLLRQTLSETDRGGVAAQIREALEDPANWWPEQLAPVSLSEVRITRRSVWAAGGARVTSDPEGNLQIEIEYGEVTTGVVVPTAPRTLVIPFGAYAQEE
ncbi:MAG TPA: hypothetical protein VNJ87_00105, partial [Candidatus Macondimonas sp.]|nr:hypothetical protein [Candidatus Macondimonas sp.]